MDLLTGGFDEKNILKVLKNLKPEQIQQGMDLLKGIQGGGDQNKGADTWR